MVVPDRDRLYRHFSMGDRPDKKTRRQHPNYPWPGVKAFMLKADAQGLSVDSGAVWRGDAMPKILDLISRTPRRDGGYLDPDDFGAVVLAAPDVVDRGFSIRASPILNHDTLPDNDAHCDIERPAGANILGSFAMELFSIAYGYAAPRKCTARGTPWDRLNPDLA